MKRLLKHIWLAGCFIAILIVAFSFTAIASDRGYQITIDYEYDGKVIDGALFHFYKVGEISADGTMKLTGAYKAFPVNMNVDQESELQDAAETLYGYIQKEELAPVNEAITNMQGRLTVDHLEKGLYLVTGQPYFADELIYRTQPLWICLPMGNQNHVIMNVKASAEQKQYEPISVKVLKNWNDQNHSWGRPDKVTVYLLKDGETIDEVVLNKENNWKYIWNGLNPNSHWNIVEEPVEDYLVTVTKTGKTFLVTNTGTSEMTPDGDGGNDDGGNGGGENDDDNPKENIPSGPPTEPFVEVMVNQPENVTNSYEDDEEEYFLQVLPQTGMVWWPVVLMVFAGVICIISGISLCRKAKDE